MKKGISIIFMGMFLLGLGMYSCKNKGGSSVDKRIHKKRKKAGSLDCPMKDC